VMDSSTFNMSAGLLADGGPCPNDACWQVRCP
jgi:hypothetical protein